MRYASVLFALALLCLAACEKTLDAPPPLTYDAGGRLDGSVPPVDGAVPVDARVGVDAGGPVDAGPPLPSSGRLTAAEGGALQSPDGTFVLYVPPGALATDTDIAITEVPTAMWPAETATSPPLAGVYDVQPDGLAFTTPAYAIHRFPGRAAALISPEGHPRFAFHHARGASGTVEVVPTETRLSAYGSAVVAEVSHLSAHWASVEITGSRATLTARVVAEAGRHAVDTEWTASHVSLQTAGSLSMVGVSVASGVATLGSASVVPLPHAGWSELTSVREDDVFWRFLWLVGEIPDEVRRSQRSPRTMVPVIDSATPYSFPMPLPGWRCVYPEDPGTSAIWIGVGATVVLPGATDPGFYDLKLDIGTPDCIVREEKAEYLAQRATLGDARVAPLAVPAMSTRNLADSMGAFGQLVTIPPGRTIRVCVTASMPTSVTYFPRFPPGYTFVDVPPPGCTEITNLDGVNPNDVLVVTEGAGAPNNVTVTTTLL